MFCKLFHKSVSADQKFSVLLQIVVRGKAKICGTDSHLLGWASNIPSMQFCRDLVGLIDRQLTIWLTDIELVNLELIRFLEDTIYSI